MRKLAVIALLLALCLALCLALPAPPALAGDDDPSEERLIRAEPSIGRRILAAPYGLLVVATWPVKRLLFLAEDINAPGRLTDVVLYPVRVFCDGDDS